MDLYCGPVVLSVGATGYVYSIFSWIDPEKIYHIHLPQCVSYHKGNLIYHPFTNLLSIDAHPNSPYYQSFDGALYRKDGTLVFVPMGKRSLHLAPYAKSIHYQTLWLHEKLTEIIVDEDHPFFAMRHGCLTTKDGGKVFFVANPEKKLWITKNTTEISEDVICQDPRSVEIEPGNETFFLENGVLYKKDGKIVYQFNQEQVVIPTGVTKIDTWAARRHLSKVKSITTAEDHPVFRAEDNTLLNTRGKRVVYVSPRAENVFVPDGYDFDWICLSDANALKEISVPETMRRVKEAFGSLRQLRAPLIVTVRWTEGGTFTTQGPLYDIMKTIQSGTVEVKRGSEIPCLEMFLAGKITKAVERRAFLFSAFQIICRLIDQNDIARLERVIADHRLITRKNVRRLIRYAQEVKNDAAADLLLAAKNSSLPPRLPCPDQDPGKENEKNEEAASC